MPDELILQLNDDDDLALSLEDDSELELNLGDTVPSYEKDYEKLVKKPRINGVELIGNKTSQQLNIQETEALTNLEIEEIIQHVFGGE